MPDIVTRQIGNGHFEDHKRTGLSLARRWNSSCDDDDDDDDNDAYKYMNKKKRGRYLLKGRRIPEGCYLKSKIHVQYLLLQSEIWTFPS
jgi:hypothetical protein